MAANWPIPAADVGSRRTATRKTLGATSFSNSSHFAPMLNSNRMNPVALLFGRARLATKPAPTGSTAFENTIGTVRVSACNAATVGPAVASKTSGASATNSAAYFLLLKSRSPAAQRISMRMLRPSTHPSCCKPPKNDAMRAGASLSFAAELISTPTRRTRSCARVTSGQAADQPPRAPRNSRRLMSPPGQEAPS